MEITQKSKKFNANIRLSNQLIEYHLKIGKTETERFISYESVSNSIRKQNAENLGLAGGGTVSILFAFVVAFAQDFKFSPTSFILLCGGIGLFFQYISKRQKYLVLDTEQAPIILLDKPESAEFYEEIKTRRNRILREKHLSINWDNDMGSELNKFLILKELGAIDEFEYEKYKNEILSK